MLRELFSDLRFRLRALFHRAEVEGELDDELRFHVDVETERLVREGAPLDEARRRARLLLGGVEQVKEATRDTRGLAWMDSILSDLRYAARMFRRTPMVYSVAVAVLALGIGMNSAVYSVFRAFAVQTLPVSDPQMLFRLRGGEASPSGAVAPSARLSGPDYRDIRTRITTARDLAAFAPLRAPVQLNGAHETATIDFVSGNYFKTLQIRPLLGRLLRDDDDPPGAPAPNAVISEALWRRDFGSRPDILGQSIRLAGAPLTVVGVLPSPFIGLSADQPAGIWMPSGMYDVAAVQAGLLSARDYPVMMVFGRRPAGVALAAVAAELARIAQDLNHDFPDYHQRFRVETSDGSRLLDEADAAQSLQVLTIIWGVLLAVHLIACSNVASVLVARAVARRPEIATRLALGASTAKIVRQLLAESLLLAALAVAFGIGIAVATLRILSATDLFAAYDLRVDVAVLAAAAGVGVLTAFLFGLVPALESARTNLMRAMRAGISDNQGSRRNRGSMFVTVQLVLSVVLLAMTGLAIRVVRTATNRDPGYDVEHLVFANVVLPDSSATNGTARYAAVYRALRAGVAAVPGVRAVAEAQDVPLSKHQMVNELVVPGFAYGPHETNRLGFDNVAPGYFAAMGMQLVHGSDFDERHYGDAAYDLKSVVVNESFAKHYWPGRDAIGQQVLFKGRYPATVIGVVSDTRDKSLFAPGEPRYFITDPSSMFTLVVRTSARTEAVAPMIRERIAALGLGINRPSVVLGQDMRGESLRVARMVSGALTLLTILALGLAALGLYGLVAFTMERRTREIGLRLALGAKPADIYSLASTITLRPTAVGLLLGSVLAVALSRAAASLVTGAGGLDAPILLGAVVVLVVVVACSAFLPTLRALRIEPSVALREL